MIAPVTPSEAHAQLAAQHADLRDRIARCEELADGVDLGRVDPAQLLRDIADLRVAFGRHNQFEERLLGPILLDADWLGAVRMARMVEDHIDEHRAMWCELDTTTSADLRHALADLRMHLDLEERYFLRRKVLRDALAR